VERDEQRNTDDTVAAETERVVDVKEQLPWVTTIATVTPNYALAIPTQRPFGLVSAVQMRVSLHRDRSILDRGADLHSGHGHMVTGPEGRPNR
jgi:hypothetical protein